MPILCIGSSKGGVGKSTLSVNIAATASKEGASVMLVDANASQQSSMGWRLRRETDDIFTCVISEPTLHKDLSKIRDRYDLIIIDVGGGTTGMLASAMMACDILLVPVLPSVFDVHAAKQLMRELGAGRAIGNAVNDCGEEITSLVGLLAALSCSNVRAQYVAAPAKLNLKRVKSGKLPFLDYKVVVVDTHSPSERVSDKEGRDGSSGRQTPREHLRRGHIRRLSTGRTVWVQSAIIGSGAKGRIEKGYKLL